MISALLNRSSRVVLSHEHRSSKRLAARAGVGDGAMSGRGKLRQWDELDSALASFTVSANRHGLHLSLLSSEAPVGEVKGEFRRWTADTSIFEVRRGHDPSRDGTKDFD